MQIWKPVENVFCGRLARWMSAAVVGYKSFFSLSLIYTLTHSWFSSTPHFGSPHSPVTRIPSHVLSFHPLTFSFDISPTSLSFLFNLPLFRHHTSNLSRIRSSSQLLSPLGFFSPPVFDQRWPSRLFQRLVHQMPCQWCFVSQYNAICAPQGLFSCPM